MPRHARHNSNRRSADAHRNLSSLVYTSRGPSEGQHETKWNERMRCFVDSFTKGGQVFSGLGATVEEARAKAEEVAVELLSKWEKRQAA